MSGEAVAGTGTEACAPAVAVSGEPGLAEEVRAGLERRGVGEQVAGCPVVRVRIEAQDRKVMVEAEDEQGDRSRRVLHDVGTAVIIVEAWALSGVVEDDAVDLTMVPEVAEHAEVRPGPSGMEVAMAAGAGMDTREQQTANLVAGVCWLGDFGCVGLRGALDGSAEGDDGATIRAASLLATAERVWPHGRFALAMTLGLGVGMTRIDGAMNERDNVYAARGLLGLGGRVAVAPRVALEVGVSSEASLDRQAWETAKYIADPEDEFLEPPMINATVQAGVGLRYKFR